MIHPEQLHPPVDTNSHGVLKKFQSYIDTDDRKLLEQFLTIPNIVSTVSAASVWDGAEKMGTIEGLAKITGGRAGDLLDGFLARSLNQSSQLGASIDAAFDKIGVAKITYEAWKRRAVPREQLAVLSTTQLLNFGVTALAAWKRPNVKWRPELSGKIGMALNNISIISHIAGYTAEQMDARQEYGAFSSEQLSQIANTCRKLGNTSFILALIPATDALGKYLKRLQ